MEKDGVNKKKQDYKHFGYSNDKAKNNHSHKKEKKVWLLSYRKLWI